MNHGKFFSLDLDASCIDKGISVFNYTDIFDATVTEGKGQTTPRYPIFVQITTASVKFILQYCVYLQQNSQKQEFLPSLETAIDDNSYNIRHMEEVLVELPLNITSAPSLSDTLKELYTTSFPITLGKECDDSREKNYILELIKRRYDNENGHENDEYGLRCKNDRILTNITYSSLSVWDMYKNSGYVLYNKNGEYNKVLRKLVLDFFFDMMHSDVFKNSMYYETMYSQFMSDYFCSAIINKSEYYYQRALVNNRLSEENNNNLQSIAIYAEKFDESEQKWLNSIQNPESDKEFGYIPNWFNSNDDIKSGTFIRFVNNIWVNVFPKFKISESWFVAPEEELQRVYYSLNDDSVSCSRDLYKYVEHTIGQTQDLGFSFNSEITKKRKTTSSKWLLRRYNFGDAYRVCSFPYVNIAIVFILFLFVCLVTEVWWLMWTLLGIICLISLIHSITCVGCGNEKCKWCSNIKTKTNIKRHANLHKGNCIVLHKGNCIVRIVKKIAENIHIHFLYPRLFASITAAWLTIALSEDMFKAFFDSKWSPSFVCLLLFFILFFVLHKIHIVVPNIPFSIKLWRSGELMLISFAMSLLVGICVIDFTGEKMLLRSGILPDFYRDNILVRSDVNDDGESALILDFDRLNNNQEKWNDSIVMNVYTHTLEKNLSSEQSTRAVQEFAKTAYENEYEERIARVYNRIDTTKVVAVADVLSDSIKGRFLLRHENSMLFKDLLEYVEHTDDSHSIAKFYNIGKIEVFWLHDFLIQFSVIAMFIGLFVQMMFEDKNLTDL